MRSFKSIPRGIIYHRLFLDIQSLCSALFTKLEDQETIRLFETNFAFYNSCKYCTCFPYARTAIYFALKAINLPPGSEIIMPPITIKAILDVILYLNLKPVYVDLDVDTLCYDTHLLKESITQSTKAILITYLFGIVPNMDEIISTCKKNNLFIIEDFSQCLNGEYREKKVGGFGHVGVYSASSIKTLDLYGGGLLITNDSNLHQKLQKDKISLSKPSRLNLLQKITIDLIRNLATSKVVFHLITFPFIKLLSRVRPKSAIKHTGNRKKKPIKKLPQQWFCRFTSFQAKLGLKILNNISNTDRMRIHNVEWLKSKTSKLHYPKGVNHSKNVYWQFITYTSNSYKLQKHLQQFAIDTSTTSLEHIAHLELYPYKKTTCVAENIYLNGLFIPSYPGLSSNDLSRIAKAIDQFKE